MRKKHFVILSLLFWAFTVSLVAQTSYVCDFENSSENSEWVLNVGKLGSRLTNKWYIGEAINNGGKQSLYISDDNGASARYGNAGTTVIAYRHLELNPGKYELSFDWLAGSAGGSDVLFVACMDTSIGNFSAVLPARPDYLEEYGLIPRGAETDTLASAWWQTSVFDIEIKPDAPQKLVFIWCNRGGEISNARGACIDNICIYPIEQCEAPENITVSTSGTSVVLHWDGNADAYQTKCFSYQTGLWTESTVKTDSVVFENMSEGVYNFYVRSDCGNGKVSHWVSHSQLVYLPDTRCIDYLTLTDKNCYTGEATGGSAAISLPGKVDFGANSIDSRHTIHMVPGEYDARTEYMLPTIPAGELASVRLGNWESRSKAEKIVYDFVVDTLQSAVLLLKYAVVMQEPENHDEDEMPRFVIRVLNEKGGTLDPNRCAEAIFSAGFGTTDATWHTVGEGSNKTLWKEWTTIGINLRDYHAKKLKIEVATYDCSLGAHYAYAYFVLGCNSGQIEGLACGNDPTTQFEAPSGFNYEWYLPTAPTEILGTEQIFQVDPMDTLTYCCDVISKAEGKEGCYYTLQASAIPNHPVPEATYTHRVEECKNIVSFTNSSHIMTVNQITTDSTHTVRPCDAVLWDFGDGTTSTDFSPEHVFPQEGGKYNVTLTAFYSYCDSTIVIPVEIPALGTQYDTTAIAGCVGGSVTLPNGLVAWSDGYYSDTLSSQFGCDSVLVYDVRFFEDVKVELYDTICSGESVLFDGADRTETGTYIQENVTIHGCDSTVVLNLFVNEKVEGALSSAPVVCADDEMIILDVDILSGIPDYVDLLFPDEDSGDMWSGITPTYESEKLTIPIPNKIRPDKYSVMVVLGDDACGSDTLPIEISILYPDSIIVQRWDDILSVTNADWNGGYEFSSYQWYKNGSPIVGQTHSYLYLPEEKLDLAAEYSVLLTRADDGKSVMTCSYIPHEIGSEEKEKLVIALDNISYNGQSVGVQVSSPARIRLYNAYGVLVSESQLSSSGSLPLPDVSGMYILEATSEEGVREVYRIIVK